MDLIKRPKKVERANKNYLSNERYQDYAEEQFKTIYDYLDNLAIGTVLYENTTGTNGSISFKEVLEEGREIEIIYKTRNYYKSSGKIPFFNGAKIVLDIQYLADNTAHTSISKVVVINNDGIVVENEQTQIVWNIADLTPRISLTNDIYITKVIIY